MKPREKKTQEIPIEVEGQAEWPEDVLAEVWAAVLDDLESATTAQEGR
jgi:hypothetical protein